MAEVSQLNHTSQIFIIEDIKIASKKTISNDEVFKFENIILFIFGRLLVSVLFKIFIIRGYKVDKIKISIKLNNKLDIRNIFNLILCLFARFL